MVGVGLLNRILFTSSHRPTNFTAPGDSTANSISVRFVESQESFNGSAALASSRRIESSPHEAFCTTLSLPKSSKNRSRTIWLISLSALAMRSFGKGNHLLRVGGAGLQSLARSRVFGPTSLVDSWVLEIRGLKAHLYRVVLWHRGPIQGGLTLQLCYKSGKGNCSLCVH